MARTNKELEKTVDELIDRRLNDGGRPSSRSDQDIYSTEAQKDLSEYKGSYANYIREAKLREQASGSKSTFYNLAAAITGSKEIAAWVSKKYDKKFTDEQQQNARKLLEVEFGIKKEKNKDKSTAVAKKIVKDLNVVKASLDGLVRSAQELSSDVKELNKRIGKLASNFNDGVVSLTNLLTSAIVERNDGKFNKVDLKPQTVSTADKEYLFYPAAPAGRQLYEKSKFGTAGRIASRKVQRSLSAELRRLEEQNRMSPLRKMDSIGDEIKRILEDQGYVRKQEALDILEEIALQRAGKTTAVETLEADEKYQILKKSLKDALEEILRDNPDLFRPDMDDFLGGLSPDLFGPGNRRRRTRRTPRRTPPRTSRIPRGVGLGALAAGTIALIVGGTAYMASGEEMDVARGDMDLLQLKYGLKTLYDDAGNTTGYEVDGRKYGLTDLPQEYKDLINAYGPGDKRSATARESIRRINADPQKYQMLEKGAAMTPPSNAPVGANIIEETKRIVVEQNNVLYSKLSDLITKNLPKSSQTTQVVNNNILPMNARKIETSNPENTYNRLLMQDIDHPTSYSNFNMG